MTKVNHKTPVRRRFGYFIVKFEQVNDANWVV